MGVDGASGLLEMKRAGALTLAQDEASSVVYGMPGEAVALGGVDEIVSLEMMPLAMVNAVEALITRHDRGGSVHP